MRQKKGKVINVVGWVLFLFAIGFFLLQMGYLSLHERFQVEYVDNRLFYIINILCVICLTLAMVFSLKPTTKWKSIGAVVVLLFIIINGWLLETHNKEIKNITSLSPDFKHILSIKENTKSGNSIYLRSYYGILARPKERIPYKTASEFKVKWLANDVAAVTYKSDDHKIQQFIATYGDRNNGTSYYYVGAEIHGKWQGGKAKVESGKEGISVTQNGRTELFNWDNIAQFGTLAIVLKKNNEAVWTISLNKNFVVHSLSSTPTTGEISLYKATMERNSPIILHNVDSK